MYVEVITAPEHKYFYPGTLKVFLAGGICKCIKWQDMVIKDFLNDDALGLSNDFNGVCLINPRRTDWIEDPGETQKQIEWEFDMIENCDVFTMYFAGGESDQPICMYELGRNILKMQYEYPKSWKDRIVITCNSNYKRLNDVLIQTSLATDGLVEVNVVDGDEESVTAHIKAIKEVLKYVHEY